MNEEIRTVLNGKAFIEGEDMMNSGGVGEIVFMTEKMLSELLKAAGREASKATIEEFERQREKQKKLDYNLRYKKTKERLKAYRALKQKVEEDKEYTPDEQDYWRLTFLEDLVGNPNSYMEKPIAEINKEEAQRWDDRRKLALTDNALHLYERDCTQHGKELDLRRFDEMCEYYGIYDDPFTSEELADKYNVTERAIYKDIGIAVHIMSVYLFGTP